MSLAPNKCYKLEFRGTNCQYKVGNINFEDTEEVKDLGIFVKKDLNWSAHVSSRLKNAYNVLFSLRRNIAFNVKSNTKLYLYKSLVLPTVTYGLFCAKQSKAIMNALERLQKKAVKWIMGNKQTCYANSLRLLNILPLPMFVQMNDLLLLSSLTRGNLANILNLHNKMTCSARRPMNYQMKIPRTERSRSEFFFRNCQIMNKVNNCFDIGNGMGLKDRLLCDMWRHYNNQFDEDNSCTWLRVCDCGQCRNRGRRCWKEFGSNPISESCRSTSTTTTTTTTTTYTVYARLPSPSQRPAPTKIASRSSFPLSLCSCSTSLSKMGIKAAPRGHRALQE